MADKYNTDATETLAKKAQHLPISEAVPIYEEILATFPTAAKYWKQYVEAHMAVNNEDATKQIFSRCLLSCYHIPLWRCYIHFIRKVNEKKGPQAHEETRKAYDFMLSYVGADIASGPVWLEYITFLKSLPALNTQEESQRMTSLRKAYQKAIVTPTHNIEQFWRDYEIFENSVSRALAKGLVSEYQPKYNSARAVYREMKKYVDEIDWNVLAVPPTGSYKEEMQWMAWKRFIAFEKGNPQRIDNVSSNKRIVYTYEQCLMHLYHYPDLWYDYAMWHAKSGSMESAVKVFQRALKALPDSDMLKYAYAELEEFHGAIEPAKKIYEGLLGDGVIPTALAHIQYIRFLRRNEGVEAARKYFLEARQLPNCTYQVYVAYAMMTFCLDKEPKIAHNIFEAGLKRFMHEPGYILEYADFLSCLNDDRNIRALFERALSSLPLEDSVEVWKRYIQFEQTYGDLASMLKVEQRRKEAFTRIGEDGESALESSLQDIVSRYSYKDLCPCSSKDLAHLDRQEWLSKNGNKKLLANEAGGSNGKMINDTPPPPPKMMIVTQKPANESSSTAYELVPKVEKIRKTTIPASLSVLIANLPASEGPIPDVDMVLSILMQSNNIIPTKQAAITSSGSNKSHNNVAKGKRKDVNNNRRGGGGGGEEDESSTVQSAPLPRDVFRIRHSHKSRAAVSSQTTTSAASLGSANHSGSTS